MKKIFLVFGLLAWGAVSSMAGTSTVVLDAGDLTDRNGAPLPAGSLLLLVAAGSDNAFYDFLDAGHFVEGDDIVLGAQAANDNNGSIGSTGNVFTFDSVTAGEAVEIRWFSNFTLAQYQSDQTPVVGTEFGTFAGITTGTTNGGAAWLVPEAGGTSNLNFTTTSANTNLSLGYADAYPNAAGQALSEVTAVPEPHAGGLALVALLTLFSVFRRRLKAQY